MKLKDASGCLEVIEKKITDNARVNICRGWIALKEEDPKKAIEYCSRGLKESKFYFVWEQVPGP